MSRMWRSRAFWIGLVLVVGGALGWFAGQATYSDGLGTGGFLALLGGLAVWGGRVWYYLTVATDDPVRRRDEG